MSHTLKWGISLALSGAIFLLLKLFANVPSSILPDGGEMWYGAIMLIGLVAVAASLTYEH
ncbi:hypothetical protein [Burkholderia sp. Tr-20390]|uniref:hypothetical protein n=1 Tax=Burkholderia sp. Tr-20390 TaxID=2703904 RepID=UPI00197DBFB6|nr:hypothetical protein [Burkholderia sp. Tr-20390]MBN3733146.1 hypothetical protein [Burkholderia sp. Tr-20390]